MKKLLVCCIVLATCSCSSVNIRTDGQLEDYGKPTFEQRYKYWWWGLKGFHSINVREICVNNNVLQMQSVYSFSDAMYGLFTLGIYAPRTARVWCKEA